MLNRGKKVIISIALLIAITIVVIYLGKVVILINNIGFKNVLSSYGNNAKFIYFIICLLQPIVLPLPEPITIMGGSSILGPSLGAAIGFSGTLVGIIIMYCIARFASESIINKIIDEKKLDKFNRYIQKNEILIILMLFVLPILPDEVICIGAGLAKISGYKFIAVASIAKLVTSVSLSYSLELIKFNWSFLAIAIICIIAIVGIKEIKLNANR